MTSEIQHNEAFMFVPYHLIISVTKTQSHKVLGSVVLEHPECFSDEKDEPEHTWEHMILVLAIMYELTLGKNSKWEPYLKMLPFDADLTCDWSQEDMEMVQDASLIHVLKDTKETLENEWLLFK